MKIKPCAECGEEAISIDIDGIWFVRPRRWSKCKAYQKMYHGRGGEICKTGIHKTEQGAVDEWNEKHGTAKYKSPFRGA